jgi:hypothetical protein
VVVYFVLALALFEHCSYRATWGKLVAGLEELALHRQRQRAVTAAKRRRPGSDAPSGRAPALVPAPARPRFASRP